MEGNNKTYDISEIENTPENRNKIFYKQILIEGYDEERDIAFDQTLIVLFSRLNDTFIVTLNAVNVVLTRILPSVYLSSIMQIKNSSFK